MHGVLSARDAGDTVRDRVDKRSRSFRTTLLQAFVDAIPTQFGSMATITLASVDYTPQELVAIFQDELESIADVREAESKRKAARQRERSTWKKNRVLHRAFEGMVRVMFENTRELVEFGLKRAKKAAKSAQVKADAAEKATATRRERYPAKKKGKR